MVSAIDPTKPADGVPARKADIRANFAATKREIETLQEVKKQDGDPYNMQFARLERPRLVGYVENSTQLQIKADGSVILSMLNSNVFELILTRNVVSLLFSDVPASGQAASVVLIVVQDSVGDHTLAWPSSVRWPNGTPPQMSTSPTATDIYALMTINGGGTWYGLVGGQRF
jgi:hypothetical protein